MATVKREQPYNFDAVFESCVVTLACSNPRFYGRVGVSLDPELMRSESAKHAMRAAHAINKDVGHGPTASVLVIQRLRAWMADGKITLEAIKLVAEMFDAAEDAGLPDVESVVAEVAPLIQQRMRDEAVQEAIDAFGKKRDLSKAVAIELKAARVGTADTSVGTLMGPESWAEVSSLKDIERMPTGIIELDSGLDGGLQRGGLGVVLGAAGDGKSMMLSHTASVNLVAGAFVGYATLELPRPEILARMKANITGIPINLLKAGDTREAQQKFAALAHRMGPCVVQDFTPYATTADDIKEWVERSEEFIGRKMDLLIVDYGDKVGVRATKKDGTSSEYTSARIVFESMRIYSFERKMFTWTASQATRQKDKKKLLDLNDTADSLHKVRVADLVISLNIEEDEEGGDKTVRIKVAKHRTGKSKFVVGPLPGAYEVGQVVAL